MIVGGNHIVSHVILLLFSSGGSVFYRIGLIFTPRPVCVKPPKRRLRGQSAEPAIYPSFARWRELCRDLLQFCHAARRWRKKIRRLRFHPAVLMASIIWRSRAKFLRLKRTRRRCKCSVSTSSDSSGKGSVGLISPLVMISANSRFKPVDQSGRRRTVEANHQILLDEAVGMIVAVKAVISSTAALALVRL